MSNDPDDWKRAEALLPTAARNASKATRLFMRGAEKTRAGDVVAEFDPADTRDRLELAGLALGFTPSRLRTGWEREIAIKDAINYYKLQQTELLQQHNWAVFNEDREAQADVMVETALLDTRTGAIPFTAVASQGLKLKEAAGDDGVGDTALRAKDEATGAALLGVAGQLNAYLGALP